MKNEDKNKLFAARPHPQTHAIIAAMLDREPNTPCRYVGKAIVTSDGFVQCGFIDSNGNYHHGAFVSSTDEIENNIHAVAEELGVSAKATEDLIHGWYAIDYRSFAGRRA